MARTSYARARGGWGKLFTRCKCGASRKELSDLFKMHRFFVSSLALQWFHRFALYSSR